MIVIFRSTYLKISQFLTKTNTFLILPLFKTQDIIFRKSRIKRFNTPGDTAPSVFFIE